MRRRNFIALFARTAVAWPVIVSAQQSAMPVIGLLNSNTPEGFARPLVGFGRGLGEEGFAEGRNVRIEYRWARGEYDRLPGLAAELVSRKVNVIAATGGTSAALAAKNASPTIPIVFEMGADPVEIGLVQSFGHPGGHITGVSLFTVPLAQKRMELLVELVSAPTTIALLVNPGSPVIKREIAEAQTAARLLSRKLVVLTARKDSEIDSAFAALAQEQVGALVVQPEPYFFTKIDQLVALAVRHNIPAVYGFRDYVKAGGLVSYGADIVDVFRRVGVYAGRILKGAQAADLPVQQPTTFELAVNLRTAKELGLVIPASVLARADEVIE
jgi:putative tryptophan/tyrosine transport system substrate-binding protein